MQTLSSPHELSSNPVRARWLEANHVRTEFLDAGIGACWFAEQDDAEAVCGETEDDAIAQLARNKGLVLWGDAGA
jgi:hypothetical protein